MQSIKRLSMDDTHRIGILALLLTGMVAITHSTLWDMIFIWYQSDTFNHCFLIIPISLFLIYEERQLLKTRSNQWNGYGAAIFCIAALFWLIFLLTDVKILAQGMLIIMIQSLVLTCVGWRKTKMIAFPLFFLFFSIPFGTEFVPALQDITGDLAVTFLELSGMPVFYENRYISIPKGSFFVAEACSGINYLIATITLGVLFGYYQYQTWIRRLLFLFLALTVPILANGLRAYGIIMIAHWSNLKYATGLDHIIYGWVWFVVVLLILFGLGSLFRQKKTKQKQVSETQSEVQALTHATLYTILLFIVLGFLLLSSHYLLNRALPVTASESLTKKLLNSGWMLVENNTLQGEFLTANKKIVLKNKKEYPQLSVDIYIFSDSDQSKLISSNNMISNHLVWQEMQSENIHDDSWTKIKHRKNLDVLWFSARYYLRGRRIKDQYDLFLYDALDRLLHKNQHSYAIIIWSEHSDLNHFQQEGVKLHDHIEQLLISDKETIE